MILKGCELARNVLAFLEFEGVGRSKRSGGKLRPTYGKVR